MTTQPQPDAFPPALRHALDVAWRAHAADVSKFGFKYLPGGVFMDSIMVLIVFDAMAPDPRALVKAMREIEDRVVTEAAKAGLAQDVTLTLAPPSILAA